jgi:hypothetical protein
MEWLLAAVIGYALMLLLFGAYLIVSGSPRRSGTERENDLF